MSPYGGRYVPKTSKLARKVFITIFAAIFFVLVAHALGFAQAASPAAAQEKKAAPAAAPSAKSTAAVSESTPAPADFLALVSAINDTQRSLSETEGVLKFLHAKLDEQIAAKLLLQARLDEQIPAARAKVPPNTNFNPATGKFDPVGVPVPSPGTAPAPAAPAAK